MLNYSSDTLPKIVILLLLLQVFAVTSASSQNGSEKTFTAKPYVRCWDLKNTAIYDFASDNDSLILSSTDGNILQLNLLDNTQLWSNSIGNKFISTPYNLPGKILVYSKTEYDSKKSTETNTRLSAESNVERQKSMTGQASVRLLDKRTGITEWVRNIDTDNVSKSFVIDSSLIQIDADLRIRSINTIDGSQNWSILLEGNLTNYAFLNNFLYVISGNNKLFKIRIMDGSTVFKKTVAKRNLTTVFVSENGVILADRLGVIYDLSESSGEIRRIFRTGGEISYIKGFNDLLLVASNDNFLYLYSFENQKVLWKKRLPGRLSTEPNVFEKRIFVSALSEPEIILIDVRDGTTLNRVNLNENEFVKRFDVNESGLYVLTGSGISRYTNSIEGCGK